MKNNKETFFKDLKKLLVKYHVKPGITHKMQFEGDTNIYEFWFLNNGDGTGKVLRVISQVLDRNEY